jgi:hypothetical protein
MAEEKDVAAVQLEAVAAQEPAAPPEPPPAPEPEPELELKPEPEAESKRDKTAHRPKEPSYSVFNHAGKRVAGGVPRAEAVKTYDRTKQRDGRAPRLVQD